MPRSKRRATSDMGSAEEDRYASKRIRNYNSSRRYGSSGNRVDETQSAGSQLSGGGGHAGSVATQLQQLSASSQLTQQSFSQKRCLAWFREYTTPDEPDTLGPEGMEKFCEDIGVEPENVVMLVLAYRMQARQMGFFTQEEWLRGLSELQCDGIAKLQSRLDALRAALTEPNCFKAVFRYAYDFARDKDQRSMDMETARAMLALLLGAQWPLHSQFARFLDQSKYKVINKDQWCNILEFSRTIHHDLSNYDVDGAWPVMLDEFVEWLKTSRAKQQSENGS